MILTADQLREHITTALEDDALVRLLDAAEEAINEAAGNPGEVTELIDGRSNFLVLSRDAAEIVSVTEIDTADAETALTPDDYLYRRPSILEREGQRWAHRVRVIYRTADWATRMSVQIQLVQLALNYEPHLTSQGGAEFAEQFAQNSAYNYEIEKAAILSPLRSYSGMVVVD